MSSEPICLNPIPADIAMITGPTMVGICLNWGFMGVLIVQLYYYYTHFSKDGLHLKVLVYGLGFLDVLQTALVTADAFHWFVFGFGNMARLDDTFLNSWDVVLLDAVISLIVQTFYCWRIYLLRRSFILPILIMMVSLTQCGAGIATAVIAHKLGQLHLISTEVIEQTMWLVGSAAADISITAVITWTLLRSKSRVPSSSHGMISKIVALTVETNSVTAFMALLGLILFLGVPSHPTLVVPPTAIIGKLYTNCLIAVLNNRNTSHQHSTQSYPAVSVSSTSRGIGSGLEQRERGGLKVEVVRNVECRQDSYIELDHVNKDSQSRFDV